MGKMYVLVCIGTGLVLGVFAQLVMPGRDVEGFALTSLVGMTGAFLGWFSAEMLGIVKPTGFFIGSISAAAVGAILVLAFYWGFVGRRKE
jgi:uncharacterized membrane protein YeaQ/YmgE (transglycosylase-associated protein family)